MSRAVTRKDYDVVSSWWKEREGIHMPIDILSDTGVMVESDGKPVCAIYLYPVLGSKVCVLGWPISDKSVSKELRSKALDVMFDKIHHVAKVLGYSHVWTTSGLKHVESRLKKHGYEVGDTNINQYWKRVS